ncbi:hypothetical protein MMPV_005057 [Pyropia vietnamensis]
MDAVADQLSGLAVNRTPLRNGAGSPGGDSQASPRRPIAGERNVLVTSALPYCNNVPHLGNLIGAVLSADVYARYLRQRGVNVVYVCGTDEYGTATENKAQAEGVSPRTICDRYTALHKGVYDWFDIRFDHFGRTSTPSQTAIVHEMFWALHEAGLIVPDDVHQLYCVATCNRPLSDRYVVGTCPRCGYEDARGDQCDSCSELLNPAELLRPRCATCGQPPETRASRHLFLDLPALASAVDEWSKDTQARGGIWSANAVAMTRTWLRDGLQPRCITRDLDWGVPVPLEGFTDKVFYVWFDAPIGYLSITAEYAPDHWREWWEAGDRPPLSLTPSSVSQASSTARAAPSTPDEASSGGEVVGVAAGTVAPPGSKPTVELVQFMGKDNVPFHTVVFPAAQLGSRRPWTMVQHLSTTEYLQYESGKFSKSRGVGVFGTDARDTNIPPAVWRYYLLVNRPEVADATFTWADLRAKNNDELLNNLGNFMHRTATFLASSFGSVMPELNTTDAAVVEATAAINAELAAYHEAFAGLSLKAALKRAMAVARLGNQFLQAAAPWHTVKTDRAAAGSALAFSASVVILLGGVLEPFLGQGWSTTALARLGVDRTDAVVGLTDTFVPPLLPAGHRTAAKPTPLFSLISAVDAERFRVRFGGAPAAGTTNGSAAAPADSGVFVLDLRVGRVATVEPHAESDRLYVATVDVGETASDGTPTTRTLVAGLRDAYTADDLRGRLVVVACNMAPATLAGVQSQAMILAAEKKKVTRVLCPAGGGGGGSGGDGGSGGHSDSGGNAAAAAAAAAVVVGAPVAPVGVVTAVPSAPLDRLAFQAAAKRLRVSKDGGVVWDKTHALVVGVEGAGGAISAGGVAEGGKIR